ncbi:MAG: PRD domain-containing protein [Enterovibrio sp.]
MDLQFRLKLLLDGQVIVQQVYDQCLAVIALFSRKFSIQLTEENAQQYITHLAGALMRADRNEAIDTIDNELYQEILDSEFYSQGVDICDALIAEIKCPLPEAERRYLIMNHCYILANLAEV